MNRTLEICLSWMIVMVCLIIPSGVAAQIGSVIKKPQGMFDLYAQNRSQGIPNYITEDFLLLAYARVMDEALTETEEKDLYPKLKQLVRGLLDKINSKTAPAPASEQTLNGVLNYLTVLNILVTGIEIADGAADPTPVFKEIEKIRAAESISRSALMRQTIDYSQFRVRGKYTRNEDLGRYFAAVKYAGAVFFPVVATEATGIGDATADLLTAQALYLSRLVMEDETLKAIYSAFEVTLSYMTGPVNDLALEDYHEAAVNMKKKPMPAIRSHLLDTAAAKGKQPLVISSVVKASALEPGITAGDAITGLRFIPQRFSPDSAAFQQLVYDRVKDYQGEGSPFSMTRIQGRPVKGYPLGIELMALLGSEVAEKRLQNGDDQNYAGYAEASQAASAMLMKAAGIQTEHLRLMQYWLTRGHHSQTDASRRLNSCLSFWTHQRHSRVLYSKQSYTLAGKGLSLAGERKSAWIEPAPELYLYLEHLVSVMHRQIPNERLLSFYRILGRCRDISSNLVLGISLSGDDIAFLNDLDRKLLPLAGGSDKPIVVDVHTDPEGGKVLEEAIGLPTVTIKTMEADKARGALFRYHEFKHPLSDRLTDEAWRKILNDPEQSTALDFSPGSQAPGA